MMYLGIFVVVIFIIAVIRVKIICEKRKVYWSPFEGTYVDLLIINLGGAVIGVVILKFILTYLK